MKKKILNTIISIIVLILFVILIDFYHIYKTSRPLIVLKENTTTNKIYYGILYNTYICTKTNETSIKLKFTKFNCPEYEVNNPKISSNYQIIIPKDSDNKTYIKGIINNKYKIIYYGTNSINISDEQNTIDLSNALIKNQITLDDIIKNLETKNIANGKLYQNNTKNYQVLVCDNNNIFIGNKLSNLCK